MSLEGSIRPMKLRYGSITGRAPGVARSAFAVMVSGLLLAVGCTTQYDVPPLERRAYELDKAIMCPVCPGESIDQSQNPLAVQMRAMVVEQLQDGRTESEIKDFFVERYGTSVLMEPPASGFNLVVWVLPPLAVGAAALALFSTLRLMRRPRADQPGIPGKPALSTEERDDYFRRIEAALDFDAPSAAPAPGSDH